MIIWRGSGNSYMQSVAISGSRYGLIDRVCVGAAARVAGAPRVEMGVHNSLVPSVRGGANGKRGANHRSGALMKREVTVFCQVVKVAITSQLIVLDYL